MPLFPGFWVHYSNPAAGRGYAVSGSAGTSFGGNVSTTSIPSGSDLSSMFPSYKRFARFDEKTRRTYLRALFAVNNLGYAANCTIGGTLTGDDGSFVDGPRTTLSIVWDAIAATPIEFVGAQADVWQLGPLTLAQSNAGEFPTVQGGATKTIPDGYCRAFWVLQSVSSSDFPEFDTTKTTGINLSVTTSPA